MASILDMRTNNPSPSIFDYWTQEITNFFTPLKYLLANHRLELFLKDVDVNYIVNTVFWIFLMFTLGFCGFYQLFHVFFKPQNIKFYKRKQFARSIWNIAFYAASTIFLYYYNEYMISPQLVRNAGRLFPTYENTIFYKSQSCEKFQLYSLFIITFYLHGAMLDFKECDFSEAVSKTLYALALVSINGYKFENYFVGLNLNLGIYNIITECLFLMALQNSHRNRLIYQVFLGLRIASWSHVFISLLPFKYLVPTLFAKNFKILLNIAIWLWYGLSIWNSPVLQYFNHQIYHSSPIDCSGEGSAAKCILLKDSSEHRHFKTLKKAYLEVKLAHEKMTACVTTASTSENSSAKTFQAIKCIMTLKRKLKRIREGRGEPSIYDTENLSPDSPTEAE